MEKTFTKKVKDEVEKHIEKKAVIDLTKASFNKAIVKKDLRVKFVKHGTVYNPLKGHHLEFNFNNLDVANVTIHELSFYGISGKLSVTSNNRYIVYIVDATTIMELIKILGASNSYKEYQKIVNYKKKVKEVTRKVNCEFSNIKKTADASISQLETIKKLLKKIKMKDLDDNLQMLIIARKKYPMMSLAELAEKLGTSKSTLNHRFIKMRKMIREF